MSDYIGGTRKPFSGLSALLYIDAKLVVPIIIITILGLVTIFSSSSGDLNLVIKQLTRIIIGIITMIFIAQVNPDNLKLLILSTIKIKLFPKIYIKILKWRGLIFKVFKLSLKNLIKKIFVRTN